MKHSKTNKQTNKHLFKIFQGSGSRTFYKQVRHVSIEQFTSYQATEE